jgi:hypothetical protein
MTGHHLEIPGKHISRDGAFQTFLDMTGDDELGMAWWNALTKQERAKWSAIAGNTGRPKDAWEAFRRGSVDQTAPVDQSRRRFLAVATGASVASVGTLAVAAAMPAAAPYSAACAVDPVFALIAAHREVLATVHAIEAEATRQSDLGIYVEADDITEPASAELDLFIELTEAVPTTLAGVVALVTYLDGINKREPWKFEDNYATPLIGALATAFNRMAVAEGLEAP